MPRRSRGYDPIDICGRPRCADAEAVIDWRTKAGASISQTAKEFGISVATVKRYGADVRNSLGPREGTAYRTDPIEGRP